MIKDGVKQIENPCTVAITYVIFDDSADMLLDQYKHFIHVNAETGILPKDILKAKKILNL